MKRDELAARHPRAVDCRNHLLLWLLRCVCLDHIDRLAYATPPYTADLGSRRLPGWPGEILIRFSAGGVDRGGGSLFAGTVLSGTPDRGEERAPARRSTRAV